jgi:H+/gluconate symporter-like permease
MIGFVGLVLSLLLLMALAYRGASVIVLAPALATLAVAISGDVPVLAAYTQIFMPALGRFLARYFPIFLLGAVFGALMDASGSARVIADRISRTLGSRQAILAVVLCVAALTYGGVSLFVVAFATFPLAASVFRAADIPRRLIPGAIALGSCTFTMTCLPGTMQIQNLIPMPYFKTTAFAAPGLGIIGGSCIFVLGMAWLNRRARSAARRAEGYGAAGEAASGRAGRTDADDLRPLPSFGLAVMPIVAVLGCNYCFAEHWIPTWDTSYLAEPRFGGATIADVRGTWSSILALLVACGLVVAASPRCRERLGELVKSAAMDSLLPLMNTASEVGYGATIAALPAFAIIRSAMLDFVPGNPLVSEAASVSVLAGITGSASGGLSIALESLGATYQQRALAAGVSPEIMHRVASMASGGLDSLPHNGAVITLLIICGLTHRESYADIGMVTVVIPLVALALVIALAGL